MNAQNTSFVDTPRNASFLSAQNDTLLVATHNDTVVLEDVQVIYSSVLERDITISITIFSTLLSLFGQSLILVAIVLNPSLHTVQFNILANQCVCDLIMTVSTTAQGLTVIILGRSNDVIICSILSVIGVGMFFSLQMLGGVLALERYIFFCHPIRYSQICSMRKVNSVILFCYVFPLLSLSPTYAGREFQSASLLCEFKTSTSRVIINAVAYRVIPFALIIFSLYRIWRITKSNRVAPALPSNAARPSTPPVTVQAKSAMQMVLLVSGTFWLAYFPALIMRVVAFRLGYSIEDINSRRAFVPAILIRIGIFMYGTISSLLNPIIYMYSRKDLRKCVYRLLRLPGSNVIATGINAQGREYNITATR